MTACSFQVTYGGSISAYVGLDVLIVTKAGSGGTTLYDGTNSTGLTFKITDDDTAPAPPGGNSYGLPLTVNAGQKLTTTQCIGTGPGDLGEPTGSVCYQALDELAAHGADVTTFMNTNEVTWTVTPSFPKTVGSTYEGATASLTLTALAVQAPANPLPATCTTSTIGQSCPASGSFAWS
jgi:hypothetical protein